MEVKMGSYTYRKLEVDDEEIRLVNLLPCKAEDEITFNIIHASLTLTQTSITSYRPSLEEIQQTLPSGWNVRETIGGRYIFFATDPGLRNSWTHPDPDFDNSSLSFQLQHPPPDFRTKYDALSYTWGSPNDPVMAYILDPNAPQQHRLAFPVGQNLACALRYLRYPDRPRSIWIDAICINQSDIEERNRQVKRMGLIYSLAQQVVIWLGPEGDNSGHAMSSLTYLGDQVEFTTRRTLGYSPGATESDWWDLTLPLPYDERTWSSLAYFFERSWFTRVWVLQEALLANQQAVVQCGTIFCSWTTLLKAILVLYAKNGVPQGLKLSTHSHAKLLSGGSKWSLPRLLLWGIYRNCTDPRDRIYGVLSLLSPAIQKKIIPQYSLSTSEVYRNVFLLYLNEVERLELLDQCNIEDRNSEMPSWIPNWAHHSGVLSGNVTRYFRQPSGISSAHTKLLSPHVLEVIGKRCAQVISVKRSTSDNTEHVLEAVRLWEPVNLLTDTYTTGEPLLDAFLEVLVQGGTRDRYPHQDNLPTLAELKKEYQALMLGQSVGKETSYLKFHMNVHGLSLLAMREGYIGVGPRGAKEGL